MRGQAAAQHGGLHQLRHRRRLLHQILPAAERRGVGRAYDDELCPVDWARGAGRCCCISSPDASRLAAGTAPRCTASASNSACCAGAWAPTPSATSRRPMCAASSRARLVHDLGARAGRRHAPPHRRHARGLGARRSRSWKAWPSRRARTAPCCSTCRHVRPLGAPIQGMQGRPASGPLSLLRAFINAAPRRDRGRARPRPGRRGDAPLGTGAARRPHPVHRGAGRRRAPCRAHGDEILARPRRAALRAAEGRGRALDRQPLADGRCRILGPRAGAPTTSR